MKRTIIRTLGTCLAAISGLIPNIASAGIVTQNVTRTQGWTTYTGTETYDQVSGQAVYGIQDMIPDCKGSLPGSMTCDLSSECYVAPPSTGDMPPTSIGGTPSTGNGSLPGGDTPPDNSVYNLKCEWYKCMTTYSGERVESCAGRGRCNPTGIFCSYTGFFTDLKNNGTPDGSAWTPTGATETFDFSGSFKFAGCKEGGYRANTGGACDGTTYTSFPSDFSSCCSACSGLNNFNSGNATVTTFVNNTMNNTTSDGYRWAASGAGAGITTCRGYLPKSSYTDTAGTYSIEYCQYKS